MTKQCAGRFLACAMAHVVGPWAPASAQGDLASVTGNVFDPNAAVIIDATRVHHTTETNSEGIYSVPNLPPGTYRIQVSKTGFKTVVHLSIVLHVHDADAIGFSLPVGAVSDTVTVEDP